MDDINNVDNKKQNINNDLKLEKILKKIKKEKQKEVSNKLSVRGIFFAIALAALIVLVSIFITEFFIKKDIVNEKNSRIVIKENSKKKNTK